MKSLQNATAQFEGRQDWGLVDGLVKRGVERSRAMAGFLGMRCAVTCARVLCAGLFLVLWGHCGVIENGTTGSVTENVSISLSLSDAVLDMIDGGVVQITRDELVLTKDVKITGNKGVVFISQRTHRDLEHRRELVR